MTRALLVLPALLLAACTSGDGPIDTPDPDPTDVPQVYDFAGRTGEGSVSYAGQTFRHLLIHDLAERIGGLTDRIDSGWIPDDGEVASELAFYVDFDESTSGALEHGLDTDPSPLQVTYQDVTGGKNLAEKIAGNDEIGQHKDWSTDFAGWDADGVTTPESLVRAWIDQVDEAAVERALGRIPLGPDGKPVPAVHVTADGQDLEQLTEKFLKGAIAFSQGADDYLDDDVDGKGLLSNHSMVVEGKTYTELEHSWDEGFGYFGAAVDYPEWTLDEIAGTGIRDANADGRIDLLTEVCWGHSTNAAKRDRGAAESAPTDLVGEAWEGFAAGRQLIDEAEGPLDAAQLEELRGYRDQAVEAWEAAIAASVVHYINEVVRDTEAIDTEAYDFPGHAKHWSEAKGFALSLQFNPRSPLSDADFAQLHARLGQGPALPTASPTEREAYVAGLLEARALLGDAYGFDAANLGDDDGANGW